MVNLENTFHKAQQAHQQGNLAQAEKLYQEILRTSPTHCQGLQFLGLLYAQSGRLDQAILCLQKATKISPLNHGLWHNLGEAQRRMGQNTKALESLNKALELSPRFIEALFSKASILSSLDQFDQAILIFKQLLTIVPNHPRALGNLGAVLIQKKDLIQAEVYIQKALDLGHTTPQNHTNLGAVFHQLNQLVKAKACFSKALSLNPKYNLAHHNLASLYLQEKSYDQAKNHFQTILANNPKDEKAWLGLAEIASHKNLIGTALDLLMESLKFLPQSADIHQRIATCFMRVKEVEKAIFHYLQALEHQKDHRQSLHGLATLHEKQGDIETALIFYKQLLLIHPESDLLRLHIDLLTPVLLQEESDSKAFENHILNTLDNWIKKGFNFQLEEILYFTGQANFMHTYQTCGNGKAVREKMVAFFRPHIPKFEPLINVHKKPHIGFLITQGHEFIFVKSVCGILNHLSQGKYKITLFCNQAGFEKTIKPQLNHPDIELVDIPANIAESAKIVHQAACDILNFWEISTDCQNFFLPFYRLAPIQTLSWGWPMTSGNPEVDYYLSSEHLETLKGDTNYTESLHRFSVLPTYYYRPDVPHHFKSRQELGFSKNENLYFCSQNLFKIQPDFDFVVLKILKADPNGRFLFLEDKLPFVNLSLNSRLKKHCQEVYNRIEFVKRRPFHDYLNLIHIADLVMDPFHYVGANTSYDAFALATPVITLPSDYHRGRHTYAAYQEMGISEAIARDPDDYVDKSVYFATHPAERTALGDKILDKCDVLFENMKIVKEYEAFFDEQLKK